jgi:biotin carboxyl carrier protein
MAEDVRAEIVATVLEVVVREGDEIGEGDTLVLLESMKMEIPVLAEVGGVVTAIKVAPGDVVQEGDILVELTAPR